jgi:putative ABC transport system ATP-binding protein
MNSPAILKVAGLSRTFQEGQNHRNVLTNVNFELGKGQRLALVGRSGSGKSTLLNLLAGVDLPDSGEIKIKNNNLTEFTENQRTLFRRQHIGFIYQLFNLIPTLTVVENISLPLELNRVARAQIAKRSNAILDAVGLSDRGTSYPDQLSGGEQQRVGIARGLVHNPSLVLADEPTGNLDAESGRQVLKLLNSLVNQNQQSLIIVTHSIEIARSAERVLELKDGIVKDVTGDLGQ